MSTEKVTPERASDRMAREDLVADGGRDRVCPEIEKLDITSLQIDESYDADCDPYNNTGQFLADAVKRRLESK